MGTRIYPHRSSSHSERNFLLVIYLPCSGIAVIRHTTHSEQPRRQMVPHSYWQESASFFTLVT